MTETKIRTSFFDLNKLCSHQKLLSMALNLLRRPGGRRKYLKKKYVGIASAM